ncbi:MAG: lipase chaperone, partial [Moritella sp.]|nr:lipase chaperone [Moritella sp.]
MSFKPNTRIVVTALSCGIAIAGGTLFLAPDDGQVIAVKAAQTSELKIIEPQQNRYPLTPEAITALVNLEGKVQGQAHDHQQQVVPLLLPSSLLGSSLPVTLDVNEHGELVINKKIQHLFDFYLSAMGEESLDIIVTRIKHSLKSQLVEPALTQGADILAGYLQYLNQVTAIKLQFEQGIDPNNIGEYALDNVIQFREMVLDARTIYLDDAVIVAFFGQADEYET